jgi:hypothetical protein
MLLQAIIGAHLETLEDFSIGSFNQPVALRMCNRGIADLNAKVLTESLKCTAGELGPIVSNDPVWDLEPVDDGLDKLDCELLLDPDHRGCFRPLCELVDGDV